VGAVSRQWSGAAEKFTISSDRQSVYPDGGTRHEGVTVYVDDQEGNRQFVARAREADVSPGQDLVTLRGEVRLVSSDGLTIEADEATHGSADRMVRAPGPVTFTRGRLSGRGTGMLYDQANDALTLEAEATIEVAPDETGAGTVEATSGRASLARQSKYLRFERDVVIRHDGRTIQGDEAVGYLSEDESHLTALDVRGGARIDAEATAPGSLQTMAAPDISLTYTADGSRIERALLAGGGSILLLGDTSGAGRTIAAELLDVGLAGDGAAVDSLIGRGDVVLEFPPAGEAPARTIRAGLLDGVPGRDGRLTDVRLSGDVEYRETSGPPPAARVVRARTLGLTFTAGMAGITDARFAGDVRLADGRLRATAESAAYAPDRGTIDLSGATGAPPTVSDERMRVDGARILLTMAGPKIAATGAVRSMLGSPEGAASGEAGTTTQRLPGFLSGDRPVNVTAEALDYDGAAQQATYRGNATLWQGASVVEGQEMVIDMAAGNLTASGGVRSSWLLDVKAAGGGDPVPTIAAAGAFEYDDEARRVTYTTDAHVTGPQGDMLAEKVELYLAGDNALERVEGYGAVTLRNAGRTTMGERLSFLVAEERYDVTGAPVRVVEGCRESTGRTLTFYKSVDKILVDGQQLSRTRTKSGSDCAEPARAGR
jgi:lipopolysaccharide export system protein LptA